MAASMTTTENSGERYSTRPIQEVARELGLHDDEFELYGKWKAKVEPSALETRQNKAKLILVTAINPTPAGEGKTTTSIALAMGMRRLGKSAVLALREPSLGPVFGVKGGGTGGGKASLVPADDINLHFTGDIHAITAAHNLLAALVDNALHFHEAVHGSSELDARQVTWNRAMDMNDRSLRHCIIGLGGKAQGVARECRFDITAASEVMAILALASDHADLEARLSRIVVGATYDGRQVTAGDIGAASAMTALMRDALKPNLVQTAEGGPAFVHCGPFANIAHGCNSLLATRFAMALGDYAITEAGFGFDLGGEKFLNIKCRQLGVWPSAVVVVATLRALKMHGGAAVKSASEPDAAALERGMSHLQKHLENAARFGLSAVVAINVFPQDPPEELAFVERAVAKLDVRAVRSEGFSRGGAGAIDLARVVCEVADRSSVTSPHFTYELSDRPHVKIEKVARAIYGADAVSFSVGAERDLRRIEELGYGELPICIAKTQLSLSDDPARYGRPEHFTLQVREVRLSAGAGMIVPLTGDMMTMPGLPRVPAARNVKLTPEGKIRGLMQGD